MSQQVIVRKIGELRPNAQNARTHSRKQINQIAQSIERFGFTNPVLIADDGKILAGHGRVAAARQLGWDEVPTLTVSKLNDAERRAYVLADNKLALNSGWDREILAIELKALGGLAFDAELTGFSLAEIDLVIDDVQNSQPYIPQAPEDHIPACAPSAVCRQGDLWELGRHRLICGDARDADAYRSLLGDERVDLIFTGPPYNVPIDGHVCGLGKIRHREFAMASGEMTEATFIEFLVRSLRPAAQACRDGAIAFVCMDWRHMGELLVAGKQVFEELKNLVVWNKTNGGMGTFYRSKHELVFVFKVGRGEHVNSFGLGDTGRYRTNVWDYPGINCAGASRDSELAMHPTVKPVELIADALRDCSKRGDIVLDQFGGSGTTLIAAEKVGRRARLIEYDPHYCDTIICRWQNMTGRKAKLCGQEICFDDLELARIEEKAA